MNIQAIMKKMTPKKKKNFFVGDTVRVHYKIKEGDKERVQTFEGIVIAFKGSGISRTFKIRKVSYGVGVERTFPFFSPRIEKVDVLTSGRVRRAKLYYLRKIKGSRATHLKTDNKKLLAAQKALETLDQGAPEAAEQEAAAAQPAAEEKKK
jgi:large subunit ribosomal protein L19